MTDQYHRDTVHRFNVIFNQPDRDVNELESTHTFEVYPIYWTAIIIPGKGYINGLIYFRPRGHDLISGSGYILVNTSTSLVPSMFYSGSIIFSGTTIVSGSNSNNVYSVPI